MTFNKKLVQLSLVSIGLILILSTYFLYPKIKKKQIGKSVIGEIEETITKELKTEEGNLFTNVEYKGFYDITNPFVVKSSEAKILTEEPDVVYMNNMRVTLHMNDGRVITITSDKGSYNKVNYDCYFEENVKATDNETEIVSEYFELLSTADYATAYNNVIITSENGSLYADKIEYDFEKEFYQIFMFNDEKVKIKVVR